MNRFAAWLCMIVSLVILSVSPALAGLPVASDRIFASGFAQYTLTIDNYLSWCSVSVDGGPNTTVAQTTLVLPDSSIALLNGNAANGTFVWGYWTGTDAGGNDVSHNATVTMSSDRNVLACCPFASNPGGTCP